jgi:hypothetical protein
VIVGIDPGKTGAIALVTDTGELFDVIDMPNTGPVGVGAALRKYNPGTYNTANHFKRLAVVEAVHAMPKQGVTSSFNFGVGYGAILGGLGALGIPVTLISASKWKRDMGLTSDKNLSRRRAVERWPADAARFARVKDDGRAEAALIAEWWRTFGEGKQ